MPVTKKVLSTVLFLCLLSGVRADTRQLDSLRLVYAQSGLQARIDLLNPLAKAGENEKKLSAMVRSLKHEVEQANVDSLRYSFMVYEGDRMAYKGNEGEGLKKLLTALKYYEKTGKGFRGSEVAYKIGRYYFYTNDLKKSLKYIRLSDQLADEKTQGPRMATNKMVMGILYQNMNMLDSALYYQEQSLMYKEKNKLVMDVPVALNNIAELYVQLNQEEKALQFLDRSIRLSDSLQKEDALAFAQYAKGKIFIKHKNYKEALSWLLPASRFWENRRTYEDLKGAYAHLTMAYEGTGNYKRAYECQKLYQAACDSLMSEAKLKNALDLEAKYQNEKNGLVIARQQAENKVTETQKRNQLTVFILVAVFLMVNAVIFYSRYKKQKKDKELIALQKVQLEVRNKDIEDSISYSSKVQQSIFPSLQDFTSSFKDSFIFFRPKEKVSGDFYWHERKDGLVLFAAADCTGHGVPGAMVSVVCSGALNRTVKEFGITDPGKILDKTRELVVETFEKSESEVKDGMDISFCVLDTRTHLLRWAGANNPLWVIRKGQEEVQQLDANKQPIGKHSSEEPFTTHHLQLTEGDQLYVFTDGYADQFGGLKGKKFKAAKMKELLLSVKMQSMQEQKQAIGQAFENWRGELEQIDDVCVIGVKL